MVPVFMFLYFCSMNKLREETAEADAILKQKQFEEGPKAAFGYGGKFGVQRDRLASSSLGDVFSGATNWELNISVQFSISGAINTSSKIQRFCSANNKAHYWTRF
jgi:hypothetical protein